MVGLDLGGGQVREGLLRFEIRLGIALEQESLLDLVLRMLPRESIVLLLLESFLKRFGLLDSVGVKLVLDDLLLQDLVAEFELVYAVDEVFGRDKPACSRCARAHHSGASNG